ncbi:cytochrome c biogenesis protein ResB [Schumannella luteola]|uniref:Cytochrome c biogenesis protein n=1 Tax=Schumannella luteola TaxID=472059 RepID=A0A852Y6S8_9MICO|nr:cytochrome c biogenesis protein ResB [Schumannella luteola]NYG97572.1 cytochrome c biogenesis protein [Schumannella luteola]TPX01579.1 cytochrome c biogenesis protein ResB [Schumannella luteola]
MSPRSEDDRPEDDVTRDAKKTRKSAGRSSADPLRPSDYIGSDDEALTRPERTPRAGKGGADAGSDAPTAAKLNPLEWIRFFWRQLTSMRTALVLLLLLALAAVPGSLVPQNSADPNGVIQYKTQNPEAFKILDALQVFDTYTSFWFSAIYLLLFVSLIGCIIPRTTHHLKALRTKPPTTPARLSRLAAHLQTTADATPETAIDEAAKLLKRQGYRVERYDRRGRVSVSAERGYLRETGNLIFHTGLLLILLLVAVGGGFIYTGEKLLVQGQSFTNTLSSYDTWSPGRFFDESQLNPYSLRLDGFDDKYSVDKLTGVSHPEDYTAKVSTRSLDGTWTKQEIKVNEPLAVGGTQVYLLGNGYAPVLKVTDADGNVVFDDAVPFRSQDTNLTGLGVLKVPDGLKKQAGFIGFFYPTPLETKTGGFQSVYPGTSSASLVSLQMYVGDLGLDTGAPVNAYDLDLDKLTQVAGRDSDTDTLQMRLGEKATLPEGLGTIEFTGIKRYIGVSIHHDPVQGFVLALAVISILGLLISLFIPRRRVWVAATADEGGGAVLEYAALARGDDPRLDDAVLEIEKQLAKRLRARAREAASESSS